MTDPAGWLAAAAPLALQWDWIWVWLALAGLAAGFIDAIVGGGGVITLPALLAAGLPPHAAVATNKIGGTGASSMATWQYLRAGAIDAKVAMVGVPAAGLAGALGAAVVLRLPERFLLGAIAVAILAVAAYVALRPRFGREDRFPGPTRAVLAVTAALGVVVGFYDGVLGPGTGTFLLFGFVGLTGMAFRRAAANGRALNFASNVGALTYFAMAGAPLWAPGLALAVGTMVGGTLGARTGLRRGDGFVRGLFLVVSALVLARLLWGLMP